MSDISHHQDHQTAPGGPGTDIPLKGVKVRRLDTKPPGMVGGSLRLVSARRFSSGGPDGPSDGDTIKTERVCFIFETQECNIGFGDFVRGLFDRGSLADSCFTIRHEICVDLPVIQ